MSQLSTDPNVYSNEDHFVDAVLSLADHVLDDLWANESDDPDLFDLTAMLRRQRGIGLGFDVQTSKVIADKLYTEYDRQDVPYLWEV